MVLSFDPLELRRPIWQRRFVSRSSEILTFSCIA
jgi:hypothetical protein